MVSESRVTWATSVPILVFLGFSVLELGPMYATDRRQIDVRQKHRLMPLPYGGGGIIINSTLPKIYQYLSHLFSDILQTGRKSEHITLSNLGGGYYVHGAVWAYHI